MSSPAVLMLMMNARLLDPSPVPEPVPEPVPAELPPPMTDATSSRPVRR